MGKRGADSPETKSDLSEMAFDLRGHFREREKKGGEAMANKIKTVTLDGTSYDIYDATAVGAITVEGNEKTANGRTVGLNLTDFGLKISDAAAYEGSGSGTYVTVDSVEMATSTAAGIVRLGSDNVQYKDANKVSSTEDRTYAVQVNKAGQLVVNVPWEDKNTGVSSVKTTNGTLLDIVNGCLTVGNLANKDEISESDLDKSLLEKINSVSMKMNSDQFSVSNGEYTLVGIDCGSSQADE